MNRTTSRIGAMILAVALVIAAVPVSAGQIQEFEPGFYTSQLTGYDIEVSGPIYEIYEAELQHYSRGEGEVVVLGSDTAPANLEISFYDDEDSPQETIDIYLNGMEAAADELTVIDRGIDGDRHWAAAAIVFDGFDIFYYMQVDEDVVGNVDVMQSILTAAFSVEIDLADAQSEVTIDGVPFLDELEPAVAAELASGSGVSDDDAVATPVEPTASHTFGISGVTVELGPDFIFLGEPEVRPDVEAVRVEGPNILSMVAVGETGDSADEVLGSFSGGIEGNVVSAEIVDEELGEDFSWRLLRLENSGAEPTFMLIVADTTTIPGFELMHAHEMPEESVAGSIITIQSQVSLDGQALLTEFDPAEMNDLAASHIGGEESTQTSQTPEVTEEKGGEQSGDPREKARLPESGDEEEGAPDGNTSETSGDIDTTPEPTSEPVTGAVDVPGKLTDSSWVGESNALLIKWDAAVWFVDAEFEGDIVSNDEFLEDTIVLQSSGEAGTTWLYLTIYGDDDVTPHEYRDQWLSEDYLATFEESGASAEIIDSRTRSGNVAVLINITTADGNEYLVVRQASVLGNGEIVIVTLDAPAGEMLDYYNNAIDVTVDGESVMRVYSLSQLERILGD